MDVYRFESKFLYACEQDRTDLICTLMICGNDPDLREESMFGNRRAGNMKQRKARCGRNQECITEAFKTGKNWKFKTGKGISSGIYGCGVCQFAERLPAAFSGCQITAVLPEETRRELFELCAAIEHEAGGSASGRYFMLKAYLIQVLLPAGTVPETGKFS